MLILIDTTHHTYSTHSTHTAQSMCTVADARTGDIMIKYQFPWDSVVWAGDTVLSERVLLTGRIVSTSGGSGKTGGTSGGAGGTNTTLNTTTNTNTASSSAAAVVNKQ